MDRLKVTSAADLKEDRSEPAEHARSHRESFLSVYRKNPLSALAQLAYWMALAARGEYVEAGAPSDVASRHLRAQNEVLIVIAKQLRRALDEPKMGYPEETLLDVIWETPDGHVPTLDWALKQAVDALAST